MLGRYFFLFTKSTKHWWQRPYHSFKAASLWLLRPSHQTSLQSLRHRLCQIMATQAKWKLELAAGPILSQAELQRGALLIGLGDSHVASASHKVVSFRRWVFYLLTVSWFWKVIRRICYLQYSLQPHTLYGIAEERPEEGWMHQQLEITCSHDSLATAILMGVPEVDGRGGTAFSPTDPRLLLHIKK